MTANCTPKIITQTFAEHLHGYAPFSLYATNDNIKPQFVPFSFANQKQVWPNPPQTLFQHVPLPKKNTTISFTATVAFL